VKFSSCKKTSARHQRVFSGYFSFQQDSAPAHRRRSNGSSAWHQTSCRHHHGPQTVLQTSTRLITAVGLQPENPKCGRVVTAYRLGIVTPGPANDR